MPGESNPLPHYTGRKFVLIGALIIAGIAVGSSFGGEVGAIASSAWNVLPFTALAIFAYLGTRYPWAKVLALVILVLTILGLSLCVVGVAMMAVIPEIFTQSDPEQAALMRGAVSADQWLSVVKVGGGIGLAIIIASRGFIYRVRRAIAGLLPIDLHSFVHTVAITTVVALMLIFIVPLLILSGPPALVVADTIMERLLAERGLGGLLLSDLYGLVWMIPASFLAVGCGVHRNFKEAAERLGLRLPTWRQAAVSMGLAVVLLLIVVILSQCIEWLWDSMDWQQTDMEAFEALMAPYLSPLGAIILGVAAGLGDELVVRGVLQPRLGIWLSNALFTSLHALQYNWDALLVVFGLGMVCGVVRKKANTTTSAIVHGMYNVLVLVFDY
jgi:hypothetical protein